MQERVTEVSFADCYRELVEAGGPHAQKLYAEWRHRMQDKPGYDQVVSFVEGFTHRFLFQITEANLDDVRSRSAHALGNLRREEAEDRRIEDFDTPFALQHLFHGFLEQNRAVPTWQEWWSWLTEGAGKPLYVREVQRHFDWATLNDSDLGHLRQALQWRMGKFYYSAFRELELFTLLRTKHGLPVKYHVLADVLLRADLWTHKVIVSVFFENTRYRKGAVGRKHRPSEIFGADFRYLDVTIRRQGFGSFWRPHLDDVAELAQKLRFGALSAS